MDKIISNYHCDSLILLVDDQVENLHMLGKIITAEDIKKAVATSGEEAIQIARKKKPDLILLDIMMPEIDGFEVCRRLKSFEETQNIPVIFLTAKTDTEDIVKGFQCGGVDFISKPFKHEELLARIRTQLELKRSRDIIMLQNEQLKVLNLDKNEFLSIAAHDLKNPIKIILGFSKLIEDRFDEYPPEKIIEFTKDIQWAGETLLKIINDLLDYNAIEEGTLHLDCEQFNLNDLIVKKIESHKIRAEEKNITIRYKADDRDYTINSDISKTGQIFDNLILNALKFSPRGKNIFINLSKKEDSGAAVFMMEIQDEGPGIKPEEMSLLFTKFARLSAMPTAGESSTGLGLSIVKKLTEMLNGKVWCESRYGTGAKFVVELRHVKY